MDFRLDKTAFRAQSYKEADNNLDHWKNKSYSERLEAAWYLISCAYNFPIDNPPKLDKSLFSTRKHKY